MVIAYESLNEYSIQCLPELRQCCRQFLKDWPDEAPGPHIVYADVLSPWLEGLLQTPEEFEDVLKRAFDVLESLVTTGSQGILDVVGASVCEPLAAAGAIDRARAFMGPATRQLCDAM